MHGDFSLYEIRIFVKIVEHANKLLKGKRVSQLIGKSMSIDGITAYMSIPIREILTQGTNDYSLVYKAAEKLLDKKIEYYDVIHDAWLTNTENPKDAKTHVKTHLIKELRYNNKDGMIHFEVSIWLLQYILDFMNGNFSMYDLQSALSLPSSYAVRLYWLTCSMTRPVTYPLAMLRDMLQVGDKYKAPKDFIRRCIRPAERILEERALNGFHIKVIHKNPNSKTSQVQKIMFIPVKRQTQTKNQEVAKAGVSAWVPQGMKQYLTTQCYFTKEELESNKNTLFEFSKVKEWPNILSRIVDRQRKNKAGKGYIINAIKGEIAGAHSPK